LEYRHLSKNTLKSHAVTAPKPCLPDPGYKLNLFLFKTPTRTAKIGLLGSAHCTAGCKNPEIALALLLHSDYTVIAIV